MTGLRISLLALLLLASPAQAAPIGLTDVRPVAVLGGDGVSALHSDREGRIFTLRLREISVHSPQGEPLARWQAPAPESPFYGSVLIAVSPAGEVFAGDDQGTTIHRYDAGGNLLGSWSGNGRTVSRLFDLAYDPRGSVVVTDDGGTHRYADDGSYLGGVTGASGTTRIGASGSRWTLEETALSGTAPSGLPIGRIGSACTIGGGDDEPCPSGPGAFGTAPPRFDAGHGLVATTDATRVQLFGAAGRALFHCATRTLVPSGIVKQIAVAGARELLLLDGEETVYRANLTSRRTRACRPMPLRVTEVRVRKRPRALTYRLNHRAGVELVSTRIDRARCDAIPDRFDPGTGCVIGRNTFAGAAPGRRGPNRVALSRSRDRWLIQVKAVDRALAQSAPPPVDVRF